MLPSHGEYKGHGAGGRPAVISSGLAELHHSGNYFLSEAYLSLLTGQKLLLLLLLDT